MSKLEKTASGLERGVNRLQIGCLMVFCNLFFGAFCLWGVYGAYVGWQLETKGQTAPGTVVRMEESNSSEGGCCVYSPVIEFRANEQVYSFEGDTASDPPQYSVGQQVRVRYNPANPGTAQVDSIFDRWLFPLIIIPAMILGALLVDFFMIRSFLRGESIESN
jgi:hypothetical protein